MNGLLLVLVLGASLAVQAAEPPAESTATWTNSYDAALADAKKQQRPVLLDFYAAWCGWCHVMDNEVYTDPRVIKLTRDYICVKVNVAHDRKTAEAYKINRLPRTIILNQNGKIVGDRNGYLDADHFVEFIKGVKLEVPASTNAAPPKAP